MYADHSALFHQSSKDKTDKGVVRIPADSSLWPKEWKTIYYKSYEKLPKITLPLAKPSADFFNLVEKRHSTRQFGRRVIPLEALSAILKYSCGLVRVGSRFRAQPSGGARFPIEVYPLVFAESDEIPAGAYHYNVREHALDVLQQRPFAKENIASLFTYDFIQRASCALVMTSVFWRSQVKYGERGYRYALLEAGHIGQNIYLVCEALGVGCCAMGGTNDEAIERLLDLDGISESVVHSVILG